MEAETAADNPRPWLLVWLAISLLSLGLVPLFDLDEAIYAQTAWEMLHGGDWLVPQANGIPFFEKPPLFYYLMDASFVLFGTDAFAARLPSLLFTLATAGLLLHAGRRLRGADTGWLAALIFLSMLEVGVLAHAAILDAALNFFLAATLICWWLWCRHGRRRDLWLAAAAMGAAVGVKGPVGVVVPLAVIGLELLISGRLTATLRAIHWPPVVLLFLLTATPWYLLILWRNGPGFLWEFLMVHNLGRALHPMQGHGGRWFYYLPVVAVSVLPWIALLPKMARGLGAGAEAARSQRFLLLWTVVTVVIFSLARTKLPHYISSIYPAVALSIALHIGPRLRRLEAAATLLLLLPLVLLIGLLPWLWPWLTGLAHHPRAIAALAQPIAPNWHSAVAALPLAVALGWLWRRRTPVALAAVGIMLQTAVVFGLLPTASAVMQGPKLAIAGIIRQLPQEIPVFSYDLNAPSISFYSDRRYHILLDRTGRERLAAMQPPFALVLRSEARSALPKRLRRLAPVIDRGGYLLLLVR
ncbi:MAG: glycosyltransferase family 39 protein [Zetaproteobacteria bacterium]|nr:MAG: glycosyltransferase family 39 protein [Zetaproteobacteria bacterium]